GLANAGRRVERCLSVLLSSYLHSVTPRMLLTRSRSAAPENFQRNSVSHEVCTKHVCRSAPGSLPQPWKLRGSKTTRPRNSSVPPRQLVKRAGSRSEERSKLRDGSAG